MEQVGNFYGYFNLIIGIIMILIGFRIYKPFKGNNEEKTYQKFKYLYMLGGIVLFISGLFKILK